MRKNNNCNAKKKVCGAVTTRATADRCENDRTQRSAAAVNKIPPTCINTGTHSTLTSGAPNNGLTCAHARKNTFTHDKTWIRNNKKKKKIINKTHKHNSAQQHTFRVYFSFVLSLSLSRISIFVSGVPECCIIRWHVVFFYSQLPFDNRTGELGL